MSSWHREAEVYALRLEKPPQRYDEHGKPLPRPSAAALVATFLALAHHWSTRERLTYPSVKTLVEETRHTERTVQYALRELEALGQITSVSSRKGGRERTIKYRLNLPSANGAPHAPFTSGNGHAATKGAPRAPFTTQKGCTTRPERVHETAVKGALHAPEPLNHVITVATDATVSNASPNGIDFLSMIPDCRKPTKPPRKPVSQEEAHLRVVAFMVEGGTRPSDVDGLVRVSGCSEAQVREVLADMTRDGVDLAAVERAVEELEP